MGYREFENNRSKRFVELINEQNTVSWEEFLEIKYDGQLPFDLHYPIDMGEVFRMPVGKYPKYSELLAIIQSWDRKSSYNNLGAAQFVIMYNYLKEKYDVDYLASVKELTEYEVVDALAYTYDYLKKHFKRMDIHLGDYQLLVRGDKQIPVNGIPDVITAMYSKPFKHGRVKAVQGESYIMLVRYPEEGFPIIETINVYGASNLPGSPHYDDQMLMFVNKERKPMTLDLEKVRDNAERIYHPIKN